MWRYNTQILWINASWLSRTFRDCKFREINTIISFRRFGFGMSDFRKVLFLHRGFEETHCSQQSTTVRSNYWCCLKMHSFRTGMLDHTCIAILVRSWRVLETSSRSSLPCLQRRADRHVIRSGLRFYRWNPQVLPMGSVAKRQKKRTAPKVASKARIAKVTWRCERDELSVKSSHAQGSNS